MPVVANAALSTGYLPTFLSTPVDLPKLSTALLAKAFMLDGSEAIPYTHFSLALNKERAFAIWVGWNIDGARILRLSRDGIPFIVDPRIPSEFQTDDSLYADNRLDRGHVARRADLLWGDRAEAEQANIDSFFFTNITPQMDNFNQSSLGGIWGRLEDAVFDEVDVEDLRVSAFGGPVLREDDRMFRDRKIPREFWKVLAFIEDGELKAKGFLLTQSIDARAALDLNEFKVFQVALSEIEDRCDLQFPSNLRSGDALGARLAAAAAPFSERKPVTSLRNVDWS